MHFLGTKKKVKKSTIVSFWAQDWAIVHGWSQHEAATIEQTVPWRFFEIEILSDLLRPA